MFVIPNEAAALHDPSEGALHNPAPANDDEAFHPWHASDDLEGDVGFVLRPADELPGIPAVGEDILDEGEPAPGSLQHALRSLAVLDVGAVDLDREQAAVGVRQDMSLAPMDAFSSVIAFGTPF